MLRMHCKELVKLNHVVWFVRLELRYKLTRCSMNLVCIWIYVYLPRVFWCEEMGFIERNEYGGEKMDECYMNNCNKIERETCMK
jgi:hypothetical protein